MRFEIPPPDDLPPALPSALPELFRDDVLVIETSQLWLRWPRAADAPALQRFAGLEEVARMIATWPHPLPPMEAERRILKARQVNADGAALIMAVARKKEPARLVGMVGIDVGPDATLGLGYLLDPAFQNRGFATQAVRGLIGAAFLYSTFRRIRAESRTDNPASCRVLEKSGFIRVGDCLLPAPARSGPLQCHVYELTRDAWRSAARQSATRPAA